MGIRVAILFVAIAVGAWALTRTPAGDDVAYVVGVLGGLSGILSASLDTLTFLHVSRTSPRRTSHRTRAFLDRVAGYRPRLATGALVVTVLLAGGLAVRPHLQLQERREVARADHIAARSQGVLPQDPALANVLAAEAFRRYRTPQTRAAAIRAMSLPMRESTAVTGHSGEVTALALSRDRTMVATGSEDGTIQLWDATVHTPIGRLLTVESRSPVTSLAFSDDASVLAGGGADHTVRLWHVRSGVAIDRTFTGHREVITALEFQPGSDLLASGSRDGSVRFWHLDAAAPDQPPLGPESAEGVTALAFSPDGRHLVVGGAQGRLRHWDTRDWTRLPEPVRLDYTPITGMAFTADGSTFTVAGGGRDVVLRDGWTLAPRRDAPLHAHIGAVRSVSFSPDGAWLISGADDGVVLVWDLAAPGPPTERLRVSGDRIAGVAVTAGANDIVTAGGEDGRVRWWKRRPTRPLGEALAPGKDEAATGGGKGGACDRVGFDSVAWRPDGRVVAAGDCRGGVHFWDAATGDRLDEPMRVGAGSVVGVAYAPDGVTFVAATEDGTVTTWDAPTRTRRAKLPTPTPGVKVWDLALSPDNRTLVTAGADGLLRLWDYREGRLIDRLAASHVREAYQGVTFNRDGTLLAATVDDGGVVLWDVADRVTVGRGGAHSGNAWGVAFSPDGQWLATAGRDRKVRIWHAGTGEPDGGLPAPVPVDDVAFSADGRLLATTGGDAIVRVWDPSSRELLGELTGHEDWADGVAFAPRGHRLATTSDDGTVRLWDVDLDGWVQQLCRRAGRNLSSAEWTTHVGEDVEYERTCGQWPSGRDAG